MGVLVYDRICSGEVEAPEPEVVTPEPEVVTPEPEEPEVVTPDPEEPEQPITPEPVPIVIENPFKPECIVSKGNLVGDTTNVAFGTPFTSKNQWEEFDTKMVPVSV